LENKNINLLIGGFVTLLIGITLIGTIATQSNVVTDKTQIYDETFNLFSSGCYNVTGNPLGQVNGTEDSNCNFTLANVPTTQWKMDDCPLASVIVTNATGTTALTLNTDYLLFTSTGIIQMLNSTLTQGDYLGPTNTTLVDYTYCADDYLNASWGRSILNIVSGFFAIALLIISVGLFYQVLKNENLAGL